MVYLPSMPDLIAVSVLVTVGIAMVMDVQTRRIPNTLTLSAVALGVMVNIANDGAQGLLQSLAGLALAVAMFALPVAMRVLGAGDLKLMAAIGAIGGPVFAFWNVLLTAVVGGLLALIVLIARRQLIPVVTGMLLDAYTRQMPQATSGIRLPYAVPIAIGTLTAMAVVSR